MYRKIINNSFNKIMEFQNHTLTLTIVPCLECLNPIKESNPWPSCWERMTWYSDDEYSDEEDNYTKERSLYEYHVYKNKNTRLYNIKNKKAKEMKKKQRKKRNIRKHSNQNKKLNLFY